MEKYELLKIDVGPYRDVVEKEYKTTNSWKDVLAFIRETEGTTDSIGLHIRFNGLDYTDMDAGIIYRVAESNECSISKVTLKKLHAYCDMHDV